MTDDRVGGTPIGFRRLTPKENRVMLDESRVIAVYIEVGDAVGLMVQGDWMTRAEKAALIRAARALPVRD